MRPKFQKRSALKFDVRSETPIMKAQRIRIGKSNYPAAGKGIIPEAKYPEGHLRPSGINWGLMPLPLLGRALTGHNYVFLIVS